VILDICLKFFSFESNNQSSLFLFETFNVSSLFVASQPVLALYASGASSGLVVAQHRTIYTPFP
jgi:hypothetical protein